MKIGVMVATVAALFGFFGTTTHPAVQAPAGSAPVVAQCLTLTRSLSFGMTDPGVADLQQFFGVKMTGYFGPLTKAALIQWQINNGVISSAESNGAGVAGPRTRAAMRCAAAVNPAYIVTTPAAGAASSTEPTSLLRSTFLKPSASSTSRDSWSGDSASSCASFMLPRPSASLCTVGEWVLIRDEAGCPVEWECSDPNSVE